MYRQFNNLTELRLVFAFFVVVSHTVQLADMESLYVLRIIFSSDTAVQAFFIISAFLTLNSFESSGREFGSFYIRRFFRIMPAYVCAVLIFAFLGIIQSIFLEQRVSPFDVFRYLAANLSLLNFLQPTISGVFAGNPYPEINGALWTIKVEVGFYIIVPFLCLLAGRSSFLAMSIILIAIGLIWPHSLELAARAGYHLHPSLGHQLPGQLTYFGLGALLYWMSWSKDRLSVAVAIISTTSLVCVWLSDYRMATQVVVLPLLIFGIATLPQLVSRKSGDLSYGIYLCHFPIVQLLVSGHEWGGGQQLVLLCLVPAMAVAYAFWSWRMIELPSINFAKRITAHETRN